MQDNTPMEIIQEETDRQEKKSPLFFLQPTRGYFFTPLLIMVNVAIFLVMVASGVHIMDPKVEDLITWGGNLRSLTTEGEWWRLITSVFLHSGILHLAMNMYGLLIGGAMLERLIGSTKYIIAYLITGIMASITSIWWNDNTVGVGASGAIFGIFGLIMALAATPVVTKESGREILKSMGILVVINLLYGLKPGIDNAAHIGGFISGGLLGFLYFFLFNFREPASSPKNKLGVFLVLFIGLTAAVVFFFQVDRSSSRFYQVMDKAFELESAGIDSFNNNITKSPEVIKEKLEKYAIPNFRECIKLMDELPAAELNEKNRKQKDLYRTYYLKRASSMELRLKSIQEQTDAYDPIITSLENEIEEIGKQIKELQ